MLKHDRIESNGNVFSDLELPGAEEMIAEDAICEYRNHKRRRDWILSPPFLLVAQRQCNATRYWIGLRLSTLIVLASTVVSLAKGLVAPKGISVVVTVLPSSVPV